MKGLDRLAAREEGEALRKWAWLALLSVFVAAPAAAQDKKVRLSFGYAFSKYLEEGGGNTPLGAYLSIASIGRTVGIEADVAYHRDSEEFFTLNTVTVGLGPRFELGSAEAKPFFHALGALRYDRAEGESNTAFGGMTGGGVDIPLGPRAFFRIGADFQIFFDEGESLKTLRVTAGISF